ncbi:hypothetical protein PENARI_c008G02076 [Penicillium arizonense]|uniref:serine--tRNA ligase n=1 Tax=Penicillium arizonense TaxID=1835702 RepID=A0A1F5LIY8_PENAI|nr:hypothetical protein PENARI_c008G02076 [Penicillium arizonense]OGE53178.1 hypothetical protein PENARI_c008G02076 [Penicillium arizonense]
MASATGIPQEHPVTIESREEEPLLGRPGDVTQKPNESIVRNLFTGTASVAQAGIWILAALVWQGVLTEPLSFFTPHPLLNSSALLLQVQAALILQPTATPQQKLTGTRIHYAIQLLSVVLFVSAFVIIEINKGSHPHFVSAHGILGLITYISIVLQALVGLAQFLFPTIIFGSVEAGKRIYKYHRWSGYVLLLLEMTTVVAATQTTYNKAALHIPLWGVLVSAVLILSGVSARIARTPLRNFSAGRRYRDVLRPATAPKPTPDVKHIRQNADLYASNCLDRNYAAHADYPSKIQQLSEEARQLDHDLKDPRSRIKQLEKTIAQLHIAARQNTDGQNGNKSEKNVSEEIAELKSEAQRLKDDSQAMTERKATCTEEINRLALALPNLSSSFTPIGHDPSLVNYINFDPHELPSWTKQSPAELQARSHVTIGTELNLLDFASSATTTGWGWYFLINEGAMLEQALVQYALQVARRRGWKTVAPPSIVYSYIAEACGFQPRDQHNEQQIWSIEQNERDRNSKPQRSLTGTAEIPLAAMYAGRDINAAELPIKLVGASRCYRAEAGSRGVDTKGLYRVHEFTKVELFGWTDSLSPAEAATTVPTSDDLFNELLDMQTEILTSLHLPCRVLEMPTGDLGASATRKRDIEALFPSRLRLAVSSGTLGDPEVHDLESAWGEVTSASICTDYQSRRLAARVRGGAAKESRFPHTVNGTAMAVPRVLAAILENGWDAERGVVVVPEVLRPWMDGMESIGRR